MAKQPSKGRKAATKPKKPVTQPSDPTESPVKTGPVIDAIPAEVYPKSDAAPVQEPIADAPVVGDAAVQEPSKPTPPPPPAPAPAEKRSAWPLVLGGLIAGVIGFAVANLSAPQTDDGLTTRVAQQAAALSDLQDRVAAIPAPDLSGIESTLTDLTARVEALEARPISTVTAPSGEVGAISDEMDALRAQLAEMTGAAQTELTAAREAAAAIEQNAAQAARDAAARAALARVQTALQDGAPLGAALNDLEEAAGQTAPEALLSAEAGVPTLAALQESFPEAARAALAAARREGVAGEETTGFGAFLRNQFDVRSTTPRDGDDADAILSRAQDAIRRGRLSDALAELSGLPEVARAEMSDWLAQAELRADAVAAVDILSTTFSDN